MKRAVLLAIMALLIVSGSTIGWLMTTETGLHWAWKNLLPRYVEQLEAAEVSGRLAGPLTLIQLVYQNDGNKVAASRMHFDWDPWALVSFKFKLKRLVIDDLDISTAATADPPNSEGSSFSAPLVIQLDDLEVNRIQLTREDNAYRLNQITAALELKHDKIKFNNLHFSNENWNIQVNGRVNPTQDFAHNLTFKWQAQTDKQYSISGNGVLSGSILQTQLRHASEGAVDSNLNLEIEAPLQDLKWSAVLDWSNFEARQWDHELPETNGAVRIEAKGTLMTASAHGKFVAQESPLGRTELTFELDEISPNVTYDAINFRGLKLALPEAEFSADGMYQFSPDQGFQVRVNTHQFDPQMYLPQWPGSIDAEVVLVGNNLNQEPVINLELVNLQGELRSYPIAGKGKARWLASQLSLSEVELISGDSKAELEGNIGNHLALKWALQSSNLEEIYPDTSGQLIADGTLEGSLDSAQFEAQITGRQLTWRENQISEIDSIVAFETSLIGKLDQLPDPFSVNLQARGLQLSKIKLDALTLRSNGHQLTTVIASTEGNARFEFDGVLADEVWKGKLMEARLNSKDYGEWRLQTPADINLSVESIKLENLCLSNEQNGRLCSSIKHDDIETKSSLEFFNFPLLWAKPWMPESIGLTGLASLDADLTYADSRKLLGKIEVKLDPGHFEYNIEKDQDLKIDYQSASLDLSFLASGIEAKTTIRQKNNGQLSGNAVFPQADALTLDLEQLPVTANLQIRTDDLQLIDRYLPAIEKLEGSLSADLQVAGLLSQPELTGQATLDAASLAIPAADLEIGNLRLSAQSKDGKTIDYQAQAKVANGTVQMSGQSKSANGSQWTSQAAVDASQISIASRIVG
ncbi:MAG: hypothetical protein AAF353_10065 [Pseudomonadota bacterium]